MVKDCSLNASHINLNQKIVKKIVKKFQMILL